ncbi:Uncharacterised protein [Candidatus Burarchaeum australiense]|nr:Uncharacterised protein [Candidatus Burarchaeum australiense]
MVFGIFDDRPDRYSTINNPIGNGNVDPDLTIDWLREAVGLPTEEPKLTVACHAQFINTTANDITIKEIRAGAIASYPNGEKLTYGSGSVSSSGVFIQSGSSAQVLFNLPANVPFTSIINFVMVEHDKTTGEDMEIRKDANLTFLNGGRGVIQMPIIPGAP